MTPVIAYMSDSCRSKQNGGIHCFLVVFDFSLLIVESDLPLGLVNDGRFCANVQKLDNLFRLILYIYSSVK